VARALHLNGVMVVIDDGPHLLSFEDERGETALGQLRGFGCEPLDPAAPHPAADVTESEGWAADPPRLRWHDAVATGDLEVSADAGQLTVRLEPGGELVRIEVRSGGEGVVAVSSRLLGEPPALLSVAFSCEPGERFWGFGERSDRVERRGSSAECWVGEGARRLEDQPLLTAITPVWARRRRPDATYFPVPWVLSSRSHGILLDSPELSLFRLAQGDPGRWSVEVRAPRLEYRFFAGPRPADALRRFTEATGRQPYPARAWFLGPWFQAGHDDLVPLELEAAYVSRLREADAPVSAAETHMRRLPGGAHEQRRDQERQRTAHFHASGLACLTYLNPFVSEDYASAYARALATGALQRRADGTPYVYPAYIGGRMPPITTEGQLDFTTPAAEQLFADLTAEALEDGHDGWMEDFGEYTPPDSMFADGTRGETGHNPYPLLYHAAADRAAAAARAGGTGQAGEAAPVARFARSGWTAAARHLPLVWGGDPTTCWGYTGLASALIEGLSAGLSGIAFWGSDIGGFFSLGDSRLDQELLIRWIELGALTPLMRTKAGGISIPPEPRPQIWDPGLIGHWRRWAKLHTQLSPYLLAAAMEYVETGLPLLRHHALTHPDDPEACAREDQYLLGPDLLVAPVLQTGQRERRLYLPEGGWVDLWRSAAYEPRDGSIRMGRAAVREGPAFVELPAPLDEIPLLVRAGAVLPLLPADVWTLSDHGEGSVVRAADRADQLRLLAFPRGSWRGRAGPGLHLASDEMPDGPGWRLTLAGRRETTYVLEASLATLRTPFVPVSVELDGGDVAWAYEAARRVLVAGFTTAGGTLVVRG